MMFSTKIVLAAAIATVCVDAESQIKTVIFTRHGFSTWNQKKLIGGFWNKYNSHFSGNDDAALTEEGVDDAIALRMFIKNVRLEDESYPLVKDLKEALKNNDVEFMASNLRRAIDTLAIATQDLMASEDYKNQPYIMSDLQETSLGKDARCDRHRGMKPVVHEAIKDAIPEWNHQFKVPPRTV